jgi:2-oxoglutarate ferredoxin oxidoreductase subunit alpha
MSELIVKITGTAGQGVISAGDIFSLSVARYGLYVTTYRSFPAEIRGDGTCAFQFRMSDEQILTSGENADILIGFSKNGIKENIDTLKVGGILIIDSDSVDSKYEEFTEILKYFIPLTSIATEHASPKSKNMVALGVLAGLMSKITLLDQLKKDIQRRYEKKSVEIIAENIKALEAGYNYAKTNLNRQDNLENLNMLPSGQKLIMSGNEAIALAALVAGCRFYAGYPITPATEIMEWLAREMPKVGGKLIQSEDEIASIAACIGASYAGVKAMTATSGPGLSLMSEAIGLASMAELPLVIVDVQRGGPSTGLPTKTEQSDLNLAIYGTHGDAPKIVLAPMTVADCFYQTINAFNFAEKYQVPVIILSDATLGQKRECVDFIDLESIKPVDRLKYDRSTDTGLYVRYKNTNTGISPISSPGDKQGAYVATGLEHTEFSSPSSSPEVHKAMTEKRFRKLETATHEFISAKRYGPDDAKVGIISWGSTSGAVLEAIDMAKEKGYKVQALYPRTLHPLPNDWLQGFLKGKEIIIIVERNYTAQFANTLIYKCNSINKDIKIFEVLKYSGEPFTSREISDKIDEVIKNQSLKYTTIHSSKENDVLPIKV